jgi:hypothetical protein
MTVALPAGKSSCGVNRTSAFVVLALLLLGFGAQSGLAQGTPPLDFGSNFFVTGDYVVGGAQGMTTNMSKGYATGTITIPDPNPGIHGVKQVPAGAEVVAAVLYWQTVENTSQAFTGETGFFRPVFSGGPLAGYPITGVPLPTSGATSWSQGACTSPTSGKMTRTYRADVLAALPQDTKGNVLPNQTYEFRTPSVGNNTPLALGATLVIVYRILSNTVPLQSIVFYDGGFGQTTSALNMQQTIQGFYDAGPNGPQNPSFTSRLTLIAASGKSKTTETVTLNGRTLLSNYTGSPQTPFPGYYGTWDNPTWNFPDSGNPSNPILESDSSAIVKVVPTGASPGCLSWGAVVVATTVQNDDNDGILNSWKTAPNHPLPYITGSRPGYCDASFMEGVCQVGDANWVDLPGATAGQKDLFVQLDYMCSTVTGLDSCNLPAGVVANGTDYTFDPRVGSPSPLQSVITAFANSPNNGVHLHVNPNLPAGSAVPDVHAIPESMATCADDHTTNPVGLCPFPNQPGVVVWKGGFDFFKNQYINPTGYPSTASQAGCANTPPDASCVTRFQYARKDSWHYVLYAHSIGQAEWQLQDNSLTSVTQIGNIVTFNLSTTSPISASTFPNDPCTLKLGRVSVLYAATNINLNGTFCINSINNTGTSFTITVPGTATKTSTPYTLGTDPYLSVAPGVTNSASGVSDVGGDDSLVTLGLWGNPASATSDGQMPNTKAGTFMHELGHSLGLTHGGFYYETAGSYVPTIEANCKPNHLSVMNYMFQVDLLDNGMGTNVPDYSAVALSTLDEGVSTVGPFVSTYPASTSWFVPVTSGGTFAHCDGSPNTNGAQMKRTTQPVGNLTWSAGQDINFNGLVDVALHGYDDWSGGLVPNTQYTTTGLDLRQIGATGTQSVDDGRSFSGGGRSFSGGGRSFSGGGQSFSGGGRSFSGGGQSFSGGGQSFKGGGRSFSGGGEIDDKLVNNITRSPRNAAASENSSPRTITINWNVPSFGQIFGYNVYRIVAGTNPPNVVPLNKTPIQGLTYQDSPACNPIGYQYYVTAILANADGTETSPPQESTPSNTVGGTTAPNLLTGCYSVNGSNALTVTTGFSLPGFGASITPGPINNTPVTISFPVVDDYYASPNGTVLVTANTNLVVIGPLNGFHDGSCPALPSASVPQFLNHTGAYPQPYTTIPQGSPGFSFNGNQFTYNWFIDSLGAGCYVLEADFDSGQYDQTGLQLNIYESDSAPHITTTSLPIATAGIPVNDPIYEAGGTAPFTWGITSGSLPPGLNLNTVTGVITGTPTTAGNYPFTLMVTDSNKNTGSLAFTSKVLIFVSDAAPLGAAPYVTPNLPTGTAGIFYSNSLYQTGAVGAVTWSYTGTLPPGIAPSPTGSNTLSGTPTTAGTYNFTATATDSAGNSGSLLFTVKVLIFVSDSAAPTVTTTLPTATAGIPNYSNTIQTTGGTGALTWSISAGALPQSMTLSSSGVVSGTPTTACRCSFTVKVVDSLGNTGTQAFTMSVLIFVSDSAAPTVTATLPTATAGIPNYSNTIQTTGGTGALTWSISAGALPQGLLLDQTGKVSGTPTTACSCSFTIKVVDSLGNTGTQAFTMSVLIFVSDSAVPTINTTLPGATAGVAYVGTTIQTTGGVGTLTWSAPGLPNGLLLDQNGNITGTPTNAGTSTFSVQVMDSAVPAPNVATQNFTITVMIFVSDSTAPTVNTTLPAGTVGTLYTTNSIDEDGGSGTLTWSVSGAMPPGLSLNQSGMISGTPSAPGTYTFTVEVSGSGTGDSGSQQFTLQVTDAQLGDLIAVDGSPAALTGTLFRITPAGTSGTIAAITNGTPSGVAVDSTTGNIYVAVDAAAGSGASSVAKVTPLGVVSTIVAGLQNPVAVAVDGSGNVYVGDNQSNTISEFSSGGTPTGSTISLPSSTNVPNHIRMAFDGSGNLFVASDSIGGTSGQVEVDEIPFGGTRTTLYNTTSMSTATYALTGVVAADGTNTTYSGTTLPNLTVGSSVTISGFATGANNGPFTVQNGSSSTQLVVNNASGATTDTSSGTLTLQLTQIGTVGGIGVLADGSLELADSGAQTIYHITNPGAANMAIAAAISGLPCIVSGLANPPSAPNTSLYVTENGASCSTPQLQLAVPETPSVTTVNSTYTLSAASTASGGTTTYTGTFSAAIPVGSLITITGFTTNPLVNNGTFAVVSSGSTTLVLANPGGISETTTATAQSVPFTSPNDVAWYSKH